MWIGAAGGVFRSDPPPVQRRPNPGLLPASVGSNPPLPRNNPASIDAAWRVDVPVIFTMATPPRDAPGSQPPIPSKAQLLAMIAGMYEWTPLPVQRVFYPATILPTPGAQPPTVSTTRQQMATLLGLWEYIPEPRQAPNRAAIIQPRIDQPPRPVRVQGPWITESWAAPQALSQRYAGIAANFPAPPPVTATAGDTALSIRIGIGL